MKAIRSLLPIVICLALFQYCSPKPQKEAGLCMQGKLVKRGICGQYVVQLLGDAAGGIVYATQWTDSMSGKAYENVFTVANPCSFPATIKENDTFYFSVTPASDSMCIQCKAYTPTPAQRNSITTNCKQ